LGKIITKNGIFSFEEIKNAIPSFLGDYELNSILFCRDWLLGKVKFQLTTSGSTGVPKPIELTRYQMEASALATASALGLKKADIALVCLNTAYIAGSMMLVRGMVTNMDLYLIEPSTDPFNGIDENTKIDFTALVPFQFHELLKKASGKEIRILNSMKAILVGGAAVSSELEEMLQKIEAPVYSTYGMTETVSHIALRRLNGKEKQDSYRLLPSVRIEKDERDCLRIKSPVTNDQWIQTNDVVELLNEKEFCWLGRIDNIINSGGIKIQPEKIEKAIEKTVSANGYKEYFFASLPHPLLGEAVTLFVEDKDPGNDLFSKAIQPFLEKYEMPKAIIYVKQFARTSTGKVDRKNTVKKFQKYYY
jgi:O-succinylbenzoic acid--CoA ligase